MKPGNVIIMVVAATFLLTASFATAQHEQVVSSPKTGQPMGMMGGKMGGGMAMMSVPPEK